MKKIFSPLCLIKKAYYILTSIRNKFAYSCSPWALFFNPYYFCRKELYLAIREYGKYITGRVLDVGCGTKPYQTLIHYSEYMGLEYDSPENRKTKKADFFYDGLHFPFENETFDNILSTQVLEHVFSPDVFIQEMHRVVKKDGYVLLTVPFVWPEHEIPYDYGRYSSFGLSDLVKRNGFDIIERQKTCSDISFFFQLWNSFLVDRIGSKHYILMELAILLCVLSNAICVPLRCLFPKNSNLYLDNVILIRKVK